jgi:8-oxo-dGTP pyrophosphatase MutT (NUDIX family)
MVATADALAGDRALRARALALAGEDPLRRGDGRVAAIGLSVAATVPGGRVLLGRRRADLPLDPGRWHVVPSGMLEPGPDPIAAAVAREVREELGVVVDPRAVRMLGLGWDLERLRPEVCVALRLQVVPGRAGGDEFDVVEAFDAARPAAPLTAGAQCALALLGKETGPGGSEGP